eukprot:CAMPEP_0172191338 /NCGR_PEP_ID=MMETSP1050-20130122/23643_1 /TAXON_ID=233186 /ORGANISM="Cryptomonas curvata, Strain CCAP979/52" /LENGTH=214 /DNA_ID=CAMNT_0012866371 /DNA_START=72 /DNA_END=716 /DNA_ORIENTATION=+
MPLRRTVMASMPTTNLAAAVISAAPSGVNLLPEPVQAAIFFSCFIALGLGTAAVTEAAFPALQRSAPGFFKSWTKSFWIIGFLFALAGASHFLILKDFCNIYPPMGTWGLWYLPGSAEFHVEWTGVAELLGGLGVVIGTLTGRTQLVKASAASLLGLTLAVTPANIYMFTHGAQIPIGVELPVAGHAFRGLMQVFLLSVLTTLARSPDSDAPAQ